MSCPTGDHTRRYSTHTHKTLTQTGAALVLRPKQSGLLCQTTYFPPASLPYLPKQPLNLLSASLTALNISHLLRQTPINTIKCFPYQSQSPAVGLNKQQRKKTLV